MPLTPTQRQFMLNRLNVQPRASKRARAMTSGETLNRELTQALDVCLKAEAEVLAGIQGLYGIRGTESPRKTCETELAETQRQLKAAQRSQGVAKIQELTKRLETQKAKVAEEARIAKANESFYAKLDDAQQALDALKRHAQADHVAAQIQSAANNIAEARKQAADVDFDLARRAMHAANGDIDDGKRFADAYASYLPVRAKAGRAVGAVKQWWDRSGELTTADALATPASDQYAQAEADLKALTTALKDWIKTKMVDRDEGKLNVLRTTQATLRSNLTDVPAGRFEALKDTSGVTVLDADIAALAATLQAMKDHLAADRMAEAAMTAQTTFFNAHDIAERAARRRLAYDAQRRATLDRMNTLVDGTKKIEGKKGPDPLIGHLFSMQELVRRADRLASRESMRMEDGIAELKNIEATVRQLATVASDSASYLNARVPADERFERLQKLPAAGAIIEQIEGIEKLLAAAAKATGIVSAKSSITTGADMEDHFSGSQNWGGALDQVKQAVAQMAAAEALAGTLGDAVALHEEAAAATDKPKVLLLADKLRQKAAAARLQPHADLAAHEYQQIDGSLEEAVRLADAGKFSLAQELLEGAAAMLMTAQTVQGEHARFEAVRKPIADRAEALGALTVPPAAKVQAVIDPVNAALEKAVEADKARDWPAAHAALNQADAAATHAELVARLRREFDTRYQEREAARLLLPDPMKDQAAEVMRKAMDAADALNLDYANRFLDNVDARIAGERVKALAATPDDPDFMLEVEKMIAASGGQELLARATDNPTQLRNKDKILDQRGKEITYGKQVKSGPELLDEIVAALPDTVPPKVIAQLCKKRFGVDLFVSALYVTATHAAGGVASEEVRKGPGDENYAEYDPDKPLTQRVRSGAKIYEMLARIPEQARNNPSVKTIERRSALKNVALQPDDSIAHDVDSGGFYQTRDDAEEGLVVMSGRPGDTYQQFGANLKDANGEDQLPAVEPGFEPADDAQVDYFDFATVHEVGHAVDDRMSFMASRGAQPEYGGWIVHGGDLGPIVEAVAEHCGYDDTEEQKQYIRDLIGGANPIPPKAPAREAVAWEEARQKVHAWYDIVTNEKLWWNQSQSAQVAIKGRIYQEAYKGTWVSYLAAARTKGLTGYQFRAPAEWFAELYAGYHCNKLKKGHPARQWLSSLSL